MPNLIYPYGRTSQARLDSCDEDIQTIFNKVADYIDTAIMCGHRNRKDQNAAYPKYSSVQFPNSRHNSVPSDAIDAGPYPIDWNDKERFVYFAGIVMYIADKLYLEGKIKRRLRWGGDWNRDKHMRDDDERNALRDYPHFELEKK